MNKLVALSLLAACSSGTPPSSNPPPPWGVPISGGNLIISHDGTHAIIADADRDRVLSVDLSSGATNELALTAGDEPGRLVEDAAGRIHVALRRGGAVVTLDASLAQLARRAVCAEPRGIAVDGDSIDVACSTGELVTLPAAGGDPTRTLHLDRDLRDVLVVGGQLYVTRFRTAELLAIDATGAVSSRVAPPTVQRPAPEGPELGSGAGSATTIDAVADVAWRTIALPDGSILMSHQRALRTMLHTTSGGYGGNCGGGPVEDALTVVRPGQAPFATLSKLDGALPVDMAVSPDGWSLAVAVAGAHDVQTFSKVDLETPDDDGCKGIVTPTNNPIDDDLGAPTSVAYAPDGTLLVYYPELPALVAHSSTMTRTFVLPGTFGYDSGRALFHTQTPIGLACASCHPEGRDDGQVWQFDSEGSRRTQSVAGRILDRGPYHWTGDMADLPTLMDAVFAERMAGGTVTRSQHLSLGPWLDRVPAPAPPPAADPAAVDRGRTLFQSADVGCGTCHSGPLFTNHTIVDVGTGGAFKVPSLLGVGARPPFLHDGCAATLVDRFGACGGGDRHGHTSQLTPAQVSDLIAYLDSI